MKIFAYSSFVYPPLKWYFPKFSRTRCSFIIVQNRDSNIFHLLVTVSDSLFGHNSWPNRTPIAQMFFPFGQYACRLPHKIRTDRLIGSRPAASQALTVVSLCLLESHLLRSCGKVHSERLKEACSNQEYTLTAISLTTWQTARLERADMNPSHGTHYVMKAMVWGWSSDAIPSVSDVRVCLRLKQ